MNTWFWSLKLIKLCWASQYTCKPACCGGEIGRFLRIVASRIAPCSIKDQFWENKENNNKAGYLIWLFTLFIKRYTDTQTYRHMHAHTTCPSFCFSHTHVHTHLHIPHQQPLYFCLSVSLSVFLPFPSYEHIHTQREKLLDDFFKLWLGVKWEWIYLNYHMMFWSWIFECYMLKIGIGQLGEKSINFLL